MKKPIDYPSVSDKFEHFKPGFLLGFLPIRNGKSGQFGTTQFLISDKTPPEQSIHFFLIAWTGVGIYSPIEDYIFYINPIIPNSYV